MSSEKADAIVIRQVDFSESSRVITFFSKEFGKFAALAKGAKRIKGPFDAALDLLSQCRVVFIKKSSGALNLLTEARLNARFKPEVADLSRVYGAYYLAELLNGLTEELDPAPDLYDIAVGVLDALSSTNSQPSAVIVQFEILILREIGLLPNLFECSVCGEAVSEVPEPQGRRFSHWVSQGGVLCGNCRREEFSGTTISAGALGVLKQISETRSVQSGHIPMSLAQLSECHRFAVSAITQALGRKPSTLRYIQI